jgi:hypothetical protein
MTPRVLRAGKFTFRTTDGNGSLTTACAIRTATRALSSYS